MKRIAIAGLIAGGLLAGTVSAANAALYYRGNGLVYDDVLDVTWLQDTQLLGVGNRPGFDEANDWAANLVYMGYENWRLPSLLPVNGSSWTNVPSTFTDYAGTTDRGYNIQGVNSELGYMFFVNLGNTAHYDVNGNVIGCGTPGASSQPYCFINRSFIDPNTNEEISFLNIYYAYWTSAIYEPATGGDLGFYFDMANGFQAVGAKNLAIAAWAKCAGVNITRNFRLLHAGHFSTLYRSHVKKRDPRPAISSSTSIGLLK